MNEKETIKLDVSRLKKLATVFVSSEVGRPFQYYALAGEGFASLANRYMIYMLGDYNSSSGAVEVPAKMIKQLKTGAYVEVINRKGSKTCLLYKQKNDKENNVERYEVGKSESFIVPYYVKNSHVETGKVINVTDIPNASTLCFAENKKGKMTLVTKDEFVKNKTQYMDKETKVMDFARRSGKVAFAEYIFVKRAIGLLGNKVEVIIPYGQGMLALRSSKGSVWIAAIVFD